MPILKWLREKIVGVAETIITLDEEDLFDDLAMFRNGALVVIGSPEPAAQHNQNEYLEELIEEEAERLSRRNRRWTPEMVRERLASLKQEEQDRLRSQKVTEWFVLAMYYSQIDHPEMAEYCLFEAQIEAGAIKLQ